MGAEAFEDRAAIHDLFTRYCCALDNGEIETVVGCFTVDAILKSPVTDISGHDEIRAFAGRFAAQRAAGTQCRHMVSQYRRADRRKPGGGYGLSAGAHFEGRQ